MTGAHAGDLEGKRDAKDPESEGYGLCDDRIAGEEKAERHVAVLLRATFLLPPNMSDFPFGHHHHHHHHRHDQRPEDEEEQQRYPPPEYRPPPPEYERPYSQPPEYHRPRPPSDYDRPYTEAPVYESGGGYGAPHFPQESASYPPAPSYGSVQHVSHEVRPVAEEHHHRNPFSHVHHHRHEGGGLPDELSSKPTVRVFCQAGERYSLAIRDGNLILAESDPSDPYQHWIKDEKYSTRVKDEDGYPSFALVNKVTGEALKHSIGATHPARLWPYNPDVLDESVLWTESRDTGHGYRAIRMVNNTRLNLDAFHGDKDHGGVHDGTTLVLWEWAKGENQKWKIVPY